MKKSSELAANYDEFDEELQIFPISSLAHRGFGQLVRSNGQVLDKHQNSSCIQEDENVKEEILWL